jgi:hypothetical protein
MVLATDAIAKWFLSKYEAGEKPWEHLLQARTEAEFTALVEKARKSEGMRNDDTSIILLQWTD